MSEATQAAAVFWGITVPVMFAFVFSAGVYLWRKRSQRRAFEARLRATAHTHLVIHTAR